MNRAEILDTAKRLVTADRERDHGDPHKTFEQIANLWTTYLDVPIVAHDVAVMMTLLKIARIKANPGNQDSFIDACGYLSLSAELVPVAPIGPKGGPPGYVPTKPTMGIDPDTGRITYTNPEPNIDPGSEPNWRLHPDYLKKSDG